MSDIYIVGFMAVCAFFSFISSALFAFIMNKHNREEFEECYERIKNLQDNFSDYRAKYNPNSNTEIEKRHEIKIAIKENAKEIGSVKNAIKDVENEFKEALKSALELMLKYNLKYEEKAEIAINGNNMVLDVIYPALEKRVSMLENIHKQTKG